MTLFIHSSIHWLSKYSLKANVVTDFHLCAEDTVWAKTVSGPKASDLLGKKDNNQIIAQTNVKLHLWQMPHRGRLCPTRVECLPDQARDSQYLIHVSWQHFRFMCSSKGQVRAMWRSWPPTSEEREPWAQAEMVGYHRRHGPLRLLTPVLLRVAPPLRLHGWFAGSLCARLCRPRPPAYKTLMEMVLRGRWEARRNIKQRNSYSVLFYLIVRVSVE